MIARFSPLLATASTSLLLLSCVTVGPDYKAPDVPNVAAFENLPEGWSIGNPDAASEPRDNWWSVFGDSRLDELQKRLTANNPELFAAEARIEQARARYRGTRSDLFPDLSGGASASRSRSSDNELGAVAAAFGGGAQESYRLPLDFAWEIDLWGRVRRGMSALEADAESLIASREAARLSLQAELAGNWFALRAIEAEKTVLEETLQLRDENLELLRNRLEVGTGTELDVARVESERATAAADLAGLDQQRTQLIAAIATLVGEPASTFTTSAPDLAGTPPQVPVGLPSTMLERRPDVARAERQLAAANERIGLAEASLYPRVSLTGGLGLASADLGTLLEPESRFWSAGASLMQPLLGHGDLKANVDEAEAAFIEQFDLYRAQVLIAFQEVETSLGAIDALQRQADALDTAVSSALRSAELSDTRYTEGLSSYLEVIDAERTRLAVERARVNNLNNRYQATVDLIQALGGGW